MNAEWDRIIKATRVAQDALEAHRRMLNLNALPARSGLFYAMKAFEENVADTRRLMADLDRNQALTRLAVGHFEELRLAGVFERISLVSRELEQLKLNMAAFEARFRLPDLAERVGLLRKFSLSVSETLKRYRKEHSSFRRAIESMHTAWLDEQEKMRSVVGLATLQGIGHAVRNMPAFGHDLNAALRVDLGDWRDPITWNPEVLTDLRARSEFYVERGFNSALTDFPAPAFEESLDIACLDREPPPLVNMYGEPIAVSDDEETEEGLSRTNRAYDWLLRLETQVRRFIDEEMTNAFGSDWPKHRLPGGLYDQWKEKGQKALRSGREVMALIAYAAFPDYMLVIGKRDNWNVFAPFFGRLEDVRESFQRLCLIRLDTMHARLITQDDELLLYVEARRLMRAMTGGKK